jgi:hypothetical protein
VRFCPLRPFEHWEGLQEHKVSKTSVSLRDRILTVIRWPGRNLSAQRPDRLVQLAVTHFVEDFPNPKRDDCPALSTLDAMIQSQELPLDDVREHLLMCSECFAYYRQGLARGRTDRQVVGMGEAHHNYKPRLAPILAGGLAGVLALAICVFVVIRERNKGIGEGANLNATLNMERAPVAGEDEKVPRSAMPAATPSQSPARLESSVSNGRNSSQPLIAENRVSIDFGRYSPLRSTTQPRHSPILLRTTQNELTVKLPDGSPKGKYGVNLADPYGATLRSVEAISRDGTQLRLELNLSSVKPGDYLICVTRETEVPQCIPSVVKPLSSKK